MARKLAIEETLEYLESAEFFTYTAVARKFGVDRRLLIMVCEII